jgi:hypothetical protein
VGRRRRYRGDEDSLGVGEGMNSRGGER